MRRSLLLPVLSLFLTTPVWAEDYLVTMAFGDGPMDIIARVRDGAILPFEGEGAPPIKDPVFVGSYRIFGLGKELGTVEGGPLE